MEVEKIVKYVLAGTFSVIFLVIIAKDADPLGKFLKDSSDSITGFAKGLTSLG